MQDKRAYVMLIQPKKKPTITDVEANLNGISSLINGDLECVTVPEDNICVYFDRNGVAQDKLPNRVVKLSQTVEKVMTYYELKDMFRDAENNGRHIVGYITFTKDSFDKDYSVEERTYGVSSNNKAFQANMGGYSIFGSCLDGSDYGVRLDWYMKAEKGGIEGWKVERCYVKEQIPICDKVVAGNIVICSFRNDKNAFEDISQDMVDKYAAMFKDIPKFLRNDKGEFAIFTAERAEIYSPDR